MHKRDENVVIIPKEELLDNTIVDFVVLNHKKLQDAKHESLALFDRFVAFAEETEIIATIAIYHPRSHNQAQLADKGALQHKVGAERAPGGGPTARQGWSSVVEGSCCRV